MPWRIRKELETWNGTMSLMISLGSWRGHGLVCGVGVSQNSFSRLMILNIIGDAEMFGTDEISAKNLVPGRHQRLSL